jgi:hypothetical protein
MGLENVAYCCDCLHADHEGVRSQVSRVRQGVLLPQLGEEVVRACEFGVVQHKIPCLFRAFVSEYSVEIIVGFNLGPVPSKKQWREPPSFPC